ncbi:hypothetical protein RhiirC2_718109 [Rhizophagus irregularis]|uniref:Uncharacterized protein n=1 Tax=Rhizophagus irregularis TaxID=588596 RepID=A0A2N1MJV0_9GLOM|nr:hypothetical protein RhiirC2_718109 [Rhizophagus irregularis]
MQWIEDSINKKFFKLYEFEEFKNVNKIYDGQCLEVQSYRVVIKSLLYNNNECMNEIVHKIQLYHQLNYYSISKIYGVTRKDCINSRSLEECINKLESIGRSNKGRKVKIVIFKNEKKTFSKLLKYNNKNSIASRVKLKHGEALVKE